jgi:hypothetical protein
MNPEFKGYAVTGNRTEEVDALTSLGHLGRLSKSSRRAIILIAGIAHYAIATLKRPALLEIMQTLTPQFIRMMDCVAPEGVGMYPGT